MWIFIAEIGVAIYFYVGNKVKQKKQKETIVSFFFFDIIFDDSIGGLVINTLPYRVAIGLHCILQ
ncbi:hypothetical protein DXA19_12050 [Firmicutes bacterium AM59-13]|nr:hypothetical protein DXA19_12050 [Firmicutes bacterium AM59-13]